MRDKKIITKEKLDEYTASMAKPIDVYSFIFWINIGIWGCLTGMALHQSKLSIVHFIFQYLQSISPIAVVAIQAA